MMRKKRRPRWTQDFKASWKHDHESTKSKAEEEEEEEQPEEEEEVKDKLGHKHKSQPPSKRASQCIYYLSTCTDAHQYFPNLLTRLSPCS